MNIARSSYRARAFGLHWLSDIDLEHFAPAVGGEVQCNVIVRSVERLRPRLIVDKINRGLVYSDGIRFGWEDIATFDMFDGNLIEYRAGPSWTGTLPWPFYSTVTALLLAWRGLVPIHASAVSISGRGIMICGESGAGKSSLTAALVAQGAQFISDDLTVVTRSKSDDTFQIIAGRPGIRLFPEIAGWFFDGEKRDVPFDRRGKIIVEPIVNGFGGSVPLEHIIILDGKFQQTSPIRRFLLLKKNLFRPKWLAALPSFAANRLTIRDISSEVNYISFPSIGRTEEKALRSSADALIAMIDRPTVG
ncbi:HPr kinase/phosphorylase [Sphingorhabdus sp.]|jgi:hypothetical protein|uniref:HPr kinase/phosphorylase n=1 Tax=Sphingorhabdus sp. TaxID=1902408 RepID=UPI003BAF84DF|nr:hypothetical protein [Sphingomonadales bacterium]MBK9431519.1 hypothetical protein [Sphingomonadales bacterium]